LTPATIGAQPKWEVVDLTLAKRDIRRKLKVIKHVKETGKVAKACRYAEGKKIKRYQYTASDDATRTRALKIYDRHNQSNAISYINYLDERFPLRPNARIPV
jgi:hypothetical protein